MKKGRIARDGATVRRCQVMLDEETVQRAKALGDGNISLGLRRAVKEAQGFAADPALQGCKLRNEGDGFGEEE